MNDKKVLEKGSLPFQITFVAVFLLITAPFVKFLFFPTHALSITSNTTYSTNQVITDGLLIDNNATLTIDPGVTVDVTGGDIYISAGTSLILGDGATLTFDSEIIVIGTFTTGVDALVESTGVGNNIKTQEDLGEYGHINLAEGTNIRMNGGKFTSGEGNTQGLIRAIGTGLKPIIFESTTATGPGEWGGIEVLGTDAYDEGGDTGTKFEYVDVYNAIDAYKVVNNTQIGVYNSHIVDSTNAIRIDSTSSSIFENVDFDSITDYPIVMTPSSNIQMQGSYSFTNAAKYIALYGGAYTDSTLPVRMWPNEANQAVYYPSEGLVVGSNVTLDVDPGVIFKGDSYGFYPYGDATLNLNGTLADPIIFTSLHDDTFGGDTEGDAGASIPNAGDWDDIILVPDFGVVNGTYVEFHYGGNTGDSMDGVYSVNYPAGTLDHVSFIDCTTGIKVNGAATTVFNDITFTNITQHPVVTGLKAQTAITGTTTFTNSPKHIGLLGGVDADSLLYAREWASGDAVQYTLLTDITIVDGFTLDIDPGLIIKSGGNHFIVESGGTFNVNGSLAEPVIFTSETDDATGGDVSNDPSVAGDDDLHTIIDAQQGSISTIDHVVFKFFGNSGDLQSPAVIVNTDVFTLSNASFVTGFTPIRIVGGSTPILFNIDFDEVQGHPITMALNSDPTLSGVFNFTDSKKYIDISGDATGNATIPLQTWPGSSEKVQYFISGQPEISSGRTITVEAGSIFKSNGRENNFIYINGGTLNINGEVNSKVYFTIHTNDGIGGDIWNDGATTPSTVDWDGSGIKVNNTATVSLSHTVFDHVHDAITVEDGSPAISLTSVNFDFTSNAVINGASATPNFTFNLVNITNPIPDGSNKNFNNLNSAFVVIAHNIYWAHADGPDDQSDDTGSGGFFNDNPGGATVTDYVEYTPFAIIPNAPPGQPTGVFDGSLAYDVFDRDWTNSHTALEFIWDPVSGVDGYEYAIGTSVGGTQLVNWTDSGGLTHLTRGSLSLANTTTYYISVRSYTGVTPSSAATTDGIRTDWDAPSPPTELGQQRTFTFFNNTSTVFPEGGVVDGTIVYFRGTFDDGPTAEGNYFEFEVKPQNQAFDGTDTEFQTEGYSPGSYTKHIIYGTQTLYTYGLKFKWRVRMGDLAGNWSSWVNYGVDDNLYDFKVTKPIKFLIQMPGQEFVDGEGITGTPDPLIVGETSNEANVYAVDEENLLIPTYSGNLSLNTGDTGAEFLSAPTVNFSQGVLPFQVKFNTPNQSGWQVIASQNAGNWPVSDGESAPVPVVLGASITPTPTVNPTSSPTPGSSGTQNPGATTTPTGTTAPTASPSSSNQTPEVTQTPVPTASETVKQTLQVRVIDEENNPVEGAKVTLQGGSGIVYSDRNGVALFTGISNGTITAIVEYKGKSSTKIFEKNSAEFIVSIQVTIKELAVPDETAFITLKNIIRQSGSAGKGVLLLSSVLIVLQLLPFVLMILFGGFLVPFFAVLFKNRANKHAIVTDSLSREGVSLVFITAKDHFNHAVYRFVSDFNGKYDLHLPQGQYSITFSKHGYKETVVTMNVASEVSLQIETMLEKKSSIAMNFTTRVIRFSPVSLIAVFTLVIGIINALVLRNTASMVILVVPVILVILNRKIIATKADI